MFASFAAISVEASSRGRIVAIIPSSGHVGSTVTVNINLQDFLGFGVTGTSGYQFELNFNGAVLKPVRQGTDFHTAGAHSSGLLVTSNVVGNSIRVAGASASPTINKNGTLLSFKFEVIAAGTGNVSISNVVLDGVNPSRISPAGSSISATVFVATTGVTLNKSSLDLNVGQTERLTATVAPANATNKSVEWSSSNRNVATVDSNGNVRAVGPGTATVSAKTSSGNRVASATVRVVAPVIGVSIQGNSKILVDTSEILKVVFNPANASNQKVSWSSSNPSVATVDQDGKVTAMSAGETTITVTSQDGNKTGTFTLNVVTSMPLEGVKAKSGSMELMLGDRRTAELEFTPANATNKNMVWESSHTGVVTVDSNGAFLAVAVGEATLTGVSEDGGHTVTVNVKVLPIPEDQLVDTVKTIGSSSERFEFPRTIFFREDVISLKDDRVSITIPKLMLDETFAANGITDYETFTIKVNKLNQQLPEKFRVLSPVYEFTLEVDGKVVGDFTGDITKTFTFDPTLVEKLDKVSLYWFNESTQEWEVVSSEINELEGLVSTQINHWSKFVLLEDLSSGRGFSLSGTVSYGTLIFFMLLMLCTGLLGGYLVWGPKKIKIFNKGVRL